MPYASGKRAPGICDRCGFRYRLNRLKTEVVRGVRKNNRVCPSCWDADHPINWEGSVIVLERSGLRDPRPDTGELAQVRSLPGWNPVGNAAITMRAEIGSVQAVGG